MSNRLTGVVPVREIIDGVTVICISFYGKKYYMEEDENFFKPLDIFRTEKKNTSKNKEV